MSRPATRTTLLLAVAAFAGGGATLAAQTTCPSGSHVMSWPNPNAVWQFCWRRPALSSGAFGSGLQIDNVSYKGRSVLKRGHAPILNVKYDPGGCGGSSLCYRDWADQEVRFQSDNVIFDGYSEPTSPPLTVCDVGGGVDLGSFEGVAAEKNGTLVLTTQMAAGWYRYTMKWYFELDGTIRTTMGFAAVADSCVSFEHAHHNYWRLDFDIDGTAGDKIWAGAPLAQQMTEAVTTRAQRTSTYWEVRDSATGRGYRILAGNDATADPFAVADGWSLVYRASEIDDSGQSGPPCAIKIGNFVNGESLNAVDLVFWYGGHAHHEANHLDDCHIVGPTLKPIGNW